MILALEDKFVIQALEQADFTDLGPGHGHRFPHDSLEAFRQIHTGNNLKVPGFVDFQKAAVSNCNGRGRGESSDDRLFLFGEMVRAAVVDEKQTHNFVAECQRDTRTGPDALALDETLALVWGTLPVGIVQDTVPVWILVREHRITFFQEQGGRILGVDLGSHAFFLA
jgi:hypothetical protein